MHPFLNVGIRALITFAILIIIIRLQGKKQIAQFTYFNYVNGIVIGSLAANVLVDYGAPLKEGLFTVILWGFFVYLVSFLSLKSLFLRRLFEGVPRYLIKDSHLVEQNLRKENLTIEDLNSMLRAKNNFAVSDVELAVLELNGMLSVQSRSENQMVTREDLKLGLKKIGIALPIIVDGVIMKENLKSNNISVSWVQNKIEKQGLDLKDVLYMELGIDGKIKIEKKEMDNG